MNKLPKPIFIDPLTDFGFKRIFGSEPQKDLLIDFLNEVFQGKKQIVNLTYKNNEHQGSVKESRKNVYDLQCTGADGEQFIIEVQKVGQEFFIDRCVYYTSSLIHEQAPKGGKKGWDYQLKEVYLIGLMEFGLTDSHESKYLHEVALMDAETKEVFYNKLGYIFIEIPKFTKEENELETGLDKWLYVLKNLSKFDKIPVILNKRIFSKLFNIASTANMTKEEHIMYDRSLMQKWDYQNGLDYARKVAREEGRKEEATKAQEKARQEKEQVAKSMKEDGTTFEQIAKYTGFSIADIEKL